MGLGLSRKLLIKISQRLPARNIEHEGRPYLRRYYIGTFLGLRCYLHHFVDSDPDGLHNHPARFSASILLNGYYYEERRWCLGKNARLVRWINVLVSDALHRVVIPRQLKAVVQEWVSWSHASKDGWVVAWPHLGVWTLFIHSRKTMLWATLKDKGAFVQYYQEEPTFELEDGHSSWWRTAPNGKELFG